MSIKYFCDRCKKECRYEQEIKFKYSKGWGTKRDYYYMCDICMEEVREFIKKKV